MSEELLWNKYGMSMEWLWNEYWMIMEWLCKDYGLIMEWLWNEYGMTMEWLWNDYGMSMEWIWSDCAMIMEWVWKIPVQAQECCACTKSYACTRILCMHKILVQAPDSCACTRFLCLRKNLVHAQASCACTSGSSQLGAKVSHLCTTQRHWKGTFHNQRKAQQLDLEEKTLTYQQQFWN